MVAGELELTTDAVEVCRYKVCVGDSISVMKANELACLLEAQGSTPNSSSSISAMV